MYLLKFKFRSDLDKLEKELITTSKNIRFGKPYQLDSSIIKVKHLKKHVDHIDFSKDIDSDDK